MKLAFQIAAGILMAAAIIGVANHLYAQAQLAEADQALQQIATKWQQDESAQRRRAQTERLQAIESQRRTLEVNAAQARAQAEAAQAAHAAAAAKAAAWEKFYRPAKECERPRDWDTQVQCGNAYMRAKRQFEAHSNQ